MLGSWGLGELLGVALVWAAGIAIVAFATVPFLVFVVPRVYFSSPADIITPTGRLEMGSRILQVFLASLAGFTGLHAWLFQFAVRIGGRRQQG